MCVAMDKLDVGVKRLVASQISGAADKAFIRRVWHAMNEHATRQGRGG